MTTRELITANKVIWKIRLRLWLVKHHMTPRSKWLFSEHDLDCAYRACVDEQGLRWLAGEILKMRS